MPAGNTSLSGQYLPVVPYKLLHAYALAELGLVQQAAAYCQSMERTMQVRRSGCGVQPRQPSAAVSKPAAADFGGAAA